jgi:predicted amidohydrolase
MRVAVFQMLARTGDVAANLAMLAEAASDAKAKGAELLVAPELATTGYGAGEAIRDLAEPVEGGQVSTLMQTAVGHNIAIVAGFAERAGGAIYNSALFARPNGQRAVWRKRQLYGAYERSLFQPGDQTPEVMEFGGLKVGVLICYDVEFPELARHLAVTGADIVLVPTALPDTSHASFIAEKIVPVRAFENGVAVAYADHAGADSRFAYAGRSCIALPDGTDAVRAPALGRHVIVAEYEPSCFVKSRLANPYLADRRFDFPLSVPAMARAASGAAD